MQRLSVRLAKVAIAFHMKGHGFTSDQRVRLIGRLGDGRIWEIIKKYGPIVFAIFVKYILPLLLALEQPAGQKIAGYELEEEELVAAPIPGYDHKDDTEIE